jgi:predicted Zn-dependent protease
VSGNQLTASSRDFQTAQLLFQAKGYAKAAQYLDRVIQSDPHNDKALLLRGTTNMWLKNYRRAVHDYSAYLAINPRDAEGYGLRARAYAYLGMKSKQDADEARYKRMMTNGD